MELFPLQPLPAEVLLSILFPTREDILATPAWRTALTSDTFGIVNPGPSTICGRIEMLKFMPALREWASGSPTGRRILDFVEGSYARIHMIGMKGCGYSCFDSDCPRKGEGTAYVDIVSQYQVGGMNLHTNVVVLHELGHAKQFIENPFWFNRVAQNRPNFVDVKDIQSGALALEAGTYKPHRFKRDDKGAWQAVQGKTQPSVRSGAHLAPPIKPMTSSPLPPPGQGDGPPGAPPPPDFGGPPPFPGLPGMGGGFKQKMDDARATLGLQTFINPHKKWAVIVEQDNMARHEWPICREKGEPVRPGYSYISMV